MNDEPYKLIPPIPLMSHLAPDKEEDISMIQVSDGMARKWGVTREEADEFAARSQQRLEDAYKKGITGDEIISFTIPATKKMPEVVVDKDEFPRPDTTVKRLAKLHPVIPGGVTTAGNASGRNDGAAFLLMMSADKAKELGYTPYARWVIGADIGVKWALVRLFPI